MSNEIDKIAMIWLKYQTTHDTSYEWASDRVIACAHNSDLDTLWLLILSLCSQTDENDLSMIANIGAGPLEDVIIRFGDAAMDLIEAEVAVNRVLLRALAAVWRWDEPVRQRIDRVLALYHQEPL